MLKVQVAEYHGCLLNRGKQKMNWRGKTDYHNQKVGQQALNIMDRQLKQSRRWMINDINSFSKYCSNQIQITDELRLFDTLALFSVFLIPSPD